MSLWYATPFNNKNPRLKEETKVRCRTGYITLERYAIVQPIRKYYIPRDSWVLKLDWSEDDTVACYCEQHGGFYLVPLAAIDFK